MKISPKAIAATLVPVVASLILYLLTGDKTVLVGVLLGLASGGAAVAAPPADGVKQETVQKISDGSLSVVPYSSPNTAHVPPADQ